MKKYIFIGAYDKTDMLLCLAKVLTLLKKKVILVDTTTLKKTRYIVPTMITERKYITNFEGIDVAIGFENFDEIKEYRKEYSNESEKEYDIALYDIDKAIAYRKFAFSPKDEHYFVTAFDIFSLKKGLQALRYVEKGAVINKIYFTKNMTEDEDNYLVYLSKKYNIKWNEKDILFFPFETSDMDALFISQRNEKISMKGLSQAYSDGILFLTEEISGENLGKITQAFKHIDD